MVKFFLRLFLLLLIIIASSIIYLSYFGVKTDKFDNLIKSKANKVNQYVKLEFTNPITSSNMEILIFAVNYNVLKISEGYGGLPLHQLARHRL